MTEEASMRGGGDDARSQKVLPGDKKGLGSSSTSRASSNTMGHKPPQLGSADNLDDIYKTDRKPFNFSSKDATT